MTSFDWSGIIASVPTALVAIVAIVYSNIGNKRLQNTSILLDFSKRYQDIMLAMPEDEALQERYILLYIDLCSEEYRLHEKSLGKDKGYFKRLLNPSKSMIDEDTWDLWKDGMRLFMEKNEFRRNIWKKHRQDYASDDFLTFFDGIVSAAEHSVCKALRS